MESGTLTMETSGTLTTVSGTMTTESGTLNYTNAYHEIGQD